MIVIALTTLGGWALPIAPAAAQDVDIDDGEAPASRPPAPASPPPATTTTPAVEPSPTDPTEEPNPSPYFLSLRADLGIGGGSIGIGGRLAGSGEVWLGDIVGIGISGGTLGQSQVALFGALSGGADFVGPAFMLRSSPTGSTFVGGVAIGYASIEQTQAADLCLNFGGGGCGSSLPETERHDGYDAGAMFGWVGHPGGTLEIGPSVRVDVYDDFQGRFPVQAMLTANLEIGFAFRR